MTRAAPSTGGRRWFAAALAVLAASAVACADPGGDPLGWADGTPSSTGSSTSTMPSSTTPPGPTASTGAPPPPPSPPPNEVAALLSRLVIGPEGHAGTYERDRFDHWIDADRDGCHTRCEVLASERWTDLPGLPGGGWRSIYDGYTTDDPRELEVDHVVALAEAWRSGAATWDDDRRRAFANDLDEPGALAAVTSATNRSKSDKDPAEWQPPNRDAWCEWGLGWLRTKVRWGLTADPAEAAALTNVLRDC